MSVKRRCFESAVSRVAVCLHPQVHALWGQADRVDSCSHPTPLVPVSPSTPQGSGTPSKRQGGKKFFFTRLCRLSQQPTTEGEPSVMPVLKQTDEEEMLLEDTLSQQPTT